MKLTVIFYNNHLAFELAMVGGKSNGNPRRVSIELTPEQAAALEPRKVGVTCGQEIYEDIGAIFLEREEQ